MLIDIYYKYRSALMHSSMKQQRQRQQRQRQRQQRQRQRRQRQRQRQRQRRQRQRQRQRQRRQVQRQRWQRWSVRGMHWRQQHASEEHGGRHSRQNLLAADRLIRIRWRQVEQLEHQNVLQVDEASEVVACIRGIRMHQKSTEADRADGADGASSEYKVSEAVKVVRTR
jgi:hypothetical protein